MKKNKYEKAWMMVDDIAGVVAGMDEDSLEKADGLKKMFASLAASRSLPDEIKQAARDAGKTIREMSNGRSPFDVSYKSLCGAVESLQRTLGSLMRGEDQGDEAKKKPVRKKTAKKEKHEDIPAAGSGGAEQTAQLTQEVLDEFEMQQDLLEGFVADLKKADDHILGVVHHFFWKIGTILLDNREAAAIARKAAHNATQILSKEVNFKKGMQTIRADVEWFRNFLETSRAALHGSQKTGGESAFDTTAARCAFIEEQSYLLEKFARDVEGISRRLLEDVENLRESAGNLQHTAADSHIHDLSGLFGSIESSLKQYIQRPCVGLVASLHEAKEFINDCLERVACSGEEFDKSRIDRVATAFKRLHIAGEQTSAETPASEQGKRRGGILPDVDIDTSNPELIEFVTESREYLHDAEMALLKLEKNCSEDLAESVNEVFRGFHNIKGIAGFLNLKDVQEVAHHAESLMDKVRRGELEPTGPTAHCSFEAVDLLKEMVGRVDMALSGAAYETPDKYFDVLHNLQTCGTDEYSADETVVERETEQNENASSRSLSGSQEKQETNGAAKSDSMVKVGTARLDSLIDAVGELVIANAMVTQEPEILGIRSPRLSRNMSHLGKITRELQELAMGMRMVSIKNTFQKMTRLARDLALKLGAPVELTYSGEDTELDRNVVEEISSPLVHMVRNSVDHGIESPAERIAAGKPEKGHIHISAAHEGGAIIIKISDDGRGLDRDAILKKAISQNLVSADAALTDREIYGLIFHPGFSTAKQVTDVSGRGVGMDVVKRSIEKLRGRIDISSERGKGTVFTIHLPLTLAIIDGMVVSVANEKYIIPTISIVESLRPGADQIITVAEKGEMLSIRGDLAPLFRLHRLFAIEGANTDATDSLAVVVGSNGSRCALMVDQLVGQQQVVIKTLGKSFDNLEGVSGGAIMGDGKIALILDTTGLARLARSN